MLTLTGLCCTDWEPARAAEGQREADEQSEGAGKIFAGRHLQHRHCSHHTGGVSSRKGLSAVVIYPAGWVGCEGRTCNLCLQLLLGAHYWASKGAARQGRSREDRGAWLHQEGTEGVEGEAEFAAGRPVWQRGKTQTDTAPVYPVSITNTNPKWAAGVFVGLVSGSCTRTNVNGGFILTCVGVCLSVQTSLLDLKEHASSLASSGLKKDSKLKSLEITLEQKREECLKLENQLKRVQSPERKWTQKCKWSLMCIFLSIVRLTMLPWRLRLTPKCLSALRTSSRKWPATKRTLERPRLRLTGCSRSFGKWKTRRMTRIKRLMSWRGGCIHGRHRVLMDVCQFTVKIVHLIYVFKVFNGPIWFFFNPSYAFVFIFVFGR